MLVALGFFGLQSLADLAQTAWLFFGFNLSLGPLLGFARGITLRVWPDATGRVMMRGALLTLVLWVATFAMRSVASVAEAKSGCIVGTSTARYAPASCRDNRSPIPGRLRALAGSRPRLRLTRAARMIDEPPRRMIDRLRANELGRIHHGLAQH